MAGVTATASPRRVHVFDRARGLPPAWDDLCATLLQRRDLLAHYERTNPCAQRYYVLIEGDRPVAGAVVYTVVQNLFTFLGNVPSPIRVNLVGLPVSISPPGVVGRTESVRQLLKRVFEAERGWTVALNLPPGLRAGRARSLRMLPDMVWKVRAASLDEYRQLLLASWRRRFDRTRARFQRVTTLRTECEHFTEQHYELYLQVLRRSPERIETLSLEFFQGLPPPLELVSHRAGNRLLCWRVVLHEGRRLSFLLGGHDQDLSQQYHSYFNSLLGVLEDGLSAGAEEIAFGQTTEDPKARLGARPVETIMLLAHGNRLVHACARMASPLIAYRRRGLRYHVFREDEVRP